jgi:hypothetical protein
MANAHFADELWVQFGAVWKNNHPSPVSSEGWFVTASFVPVWPKNPTIPPFDGVWLGKLPTLAEVLGQRVANPKLHQLLCSNPSLIDLGLGLGRDSMGGGGRSRFRVFQRQQFLTINGHISRRLDAQANLAAVDVDDRNTNILADEDFLAEFTTEDQHLATLLRAK